MNTSYNACIHPERMSVVVVRLIFGAKLTLKWLVGGGGKWQMVAEPSPMLTAYAHAINGFASDRSRPAYRDTFISVRILEWSRRMNTPLCYLSVPINRC
jgi:hypothetical protein